MKSLWDMLVTSVYVIRETLYVSLSSKSPVDFFNQSLEILTWEEVF